MSAIVARAVEVARPLIDSKHHRLNVTVSEVGLAVEGDPVRLAQVISNLLNNAAKYTEPRGHIVVEGFRDDSEVVLRVRDTGQGIPPDRLASMLDLFVQGEQPLARSEGSLGVGPTLVPRLVQLERGNVEAHNEAVGRGFGVVAP